MSERLPTLPDPETDRRLLDNLRRARLDFAEVDLQLEELIASFDKLIDRQKLQRTKSRQN